LSYPHGDDLYVLPLCCSMSIFSLVLSVLCPSYFCSFLWPYTLNLSPGITIMGNLQDGNKNFCDPRSLGESSCGWGYWQRGPWFFCCVSCWSRLLYEKIMNSVENDSISLKMTIFNFTPKLLTLNNWVPIQEKSLFFSLNITPGSNCNWTPKFQSHLQISTWFPI